ncbi:sensor histidine kinase [Kibdelosporangium phytohabitans]|uniref:histidine kinase n=1 Tax=Kibdelosporangium phytohabitans TaxID=860235 RepID=A0A0N7F3B2_9PSEU|nr:sensor histidine kinase [Kibdelosporangium phytohabitans]ALG08143.1 hypothetical protein AOZ06_15570 [Kibdelosporangium phytohabitans]MBE1470873.1 signal transduction histidine kinase [Kibdelosporangium phytohabitans]
MPEKRPFLARKLKLRELVAVDVIAAAALLVAHISFLSLPGDASQEPFTGPLWFGWLISIVATAPMAVRRLWPGPVLALTLLGSALATMFDATREPWVPAAAALYIMAVTNRRPVLSLVAAVGSVVIAVAFTSVLTPAQFSKLPRDILFLVVPIMVAVWAVGRWVEARRSYTARSAHQLAQSMVGDERLRIARELHDVVAHSMSLIAVKAGIANHIADQRPEEARDALRVIESTSRTTLIEMRQMLGILRSSPTLPPTSASPPAEHGHGLTPAPGLADLPALAQQARSAGVDVTMSAPPSLSLPSGLELSAYRIVQEALTNVVKHAGPVACAVEVSVREGALRVSVVDSGRGGPARVPGSGHGLIGMRERVMMYGGQFSAGPSPSGGFAVSATLPCSGESP